MTEVVGNRTLQLLLCRASLVGGRSEGTKTSARAIGGRRVMGRD